jgi:hypothetical protein
MNTLQATNTLALTTVNALEYIIQTRQPLSTEYRNQFTIRTGFRYSHLTQTFDALVNPGASHLNSNQDFNGFGMTCALEWRHILCVTDVDKTRVKPPDPAYNWISGFVRIRGSALIGPNTRSSSFSSSLANTLGIPANSNIAQTETSFVPVGELDLGVEFWPGMHWFLDRSSYDEKPLVPHLSVILASNSQIWANVGMPSALSPSHRPVNGALYLVGAFMAAKLHW